MALKIENKLEKERLEIIEKRVDIQKKKIEIVKEKLLIEKLKVEKEKDSLEVIAKIIFNKSKRIENRKAKIEVDILKENSIIEKQKSRIDNVFYLLFPLMVTTIDEDRTFIGSEPFHTPVITGENREIVIDKLMVLIREI
jgi:hypothetical protein